ncbi:TonB-dependent siderophore receptor [Alkalimarinus alittae]|uniref:TonB-dependent siderophore receptor n=1 Tax=Alkalimarinus alittae TaxID=2961619 RepID=A0ABY6N4N3_9ALTE|nr:TonB-dependent siderophore receptor [Alkalimarinus alittae]UZE97068.1 TonB-dependent siderophore receptor [Alkalimarinus alittae]
MFKRSGLVASGVLIAAYMPYSALAEEVSEAAALEDVEVVGKLGHYSATKTDTPIMETARSVSVIDEQAMKDKGAMSVSDALMYTAGVTGQTYGFATRVDSYTIRGLDATQYQDSLQSLFGHYNNARPHIYTLEQLEVLKGPASVLYGQGTPGGLVNLVTKRPETETKREVVVEAGSFNHKQIAADLTGAMDDKGEWLYRIVAVAEDGETQVDYVDEKTLVLAPSISWRPSLDTEITALVNHTHTESDTAAQFLPIEGTLYTARNGKDIGSETYTGEPGFNHYDTESTSFTLLANHQFNDIWSIEATGRYAEGEADYAQAWSSFLPDVPGVIDNRYILSPGGSLYKDGTVPRTFYTSDSESEQSAADVRAHADFITGIVGHKFMIGAQYQKVKTSSNNTYAGTLGLNPLNPYASDESYWINVFDPVYGAYPSAAELAPYAYSQKSETDSTGIYISDQIDINQWIVNAGVRYDETKTGSQKDDAVSASAGLMYQFEAGVSPYASYAESFEPVIGTDLITGNALKPREAEQYEVGIKYQPVGTQALVTLAYFDIEITNLDNPNSLPSAGSQQEGESSVTGVELEAIVPVGDFTVETYLTKLDTEDPNGYRIAATPEVQASAWVSYRPLDFAQGLKLGLGVRYNGESWDGMDTIKTPSNTVGDLLLGYETGRWDVSLNANNFTDKEYVSTCLARGDCFYGQRRTITTRLAMKF